MSGDAGDLVLSGIGHQARLLADGQVSPRELVEACLSRIEALDPRFNAFRAVLVESALQAAGEAAARLARGDRAPLLGVPVAVKDNLDVAGEVTTIGTAAYGPPAPADSEVVRRLRAAGAIVIGKTTEPELDLWAFTESTTWGVTRNPWNPDRTTGGSSGGSAAAVTAGMVGAALGSDGGGSIRIPSACCGLFGIKPQRGRISLAPRTDHWHGLTALGPLARSVADAALLLDATATPGARPPWFAQAARRSPGRLRIAVSTAFPPGVAAVATRLDGACRAAFDETVELLRRLGHHVTRRDPRYGTVAVDLVVRYLAGVHEDAGAMAHPDRLERRTRDMARLGRLVRGAIVRRTVDHERRVAARLGALFQEHDVLMTPAVAQPALPIEASLGRGALRTALASGPLGAYTTPWNVTGQPAAAVPAGFTPDGLPLAVQLVGRSGDEARLLSLAAQLEAHRPWADRVPPGC